jgi:hypothetical protein
VWRLESAVTVVSFKSKGRQGEKVLIESSHQQLIKKIEEKESTFYNVLNYRFSRIERSKDAAEFPSGKQGCQDVGAIFND